MRIIVIELQGEFEVPRMVAYEVARHTRRGYLVRRGNKVVQVSKSDKAVYVSPSIAMDAYRHRVRETIRKLDDARKEVAEAARDLRLSEVPLRLYDSAGNESAVSLHQDGTWAS